ncbi:MAG TPA: DUF2789 family protein, partial [Anaerolineales bacterium]
MQAPAYSLNTLFAQLGLEHSDEAIDKFIREHAPIPATVTLSEAPCWNESQRKLLTESIANDS